jgi:site-specific recombinase XerD
MWDKPKERVKSGHLLASIINPDISTKKTEVVNGLSKIQVTGKAVTAAQAKVMFEAGDLTNFFRFAKSFAEEVKNKREGGTLENYRKHVKYLEDFHGGTALTFDEINHDYLVRFEAYLRVKEKESKTGETIGGNYIHAILKTIRTIFNAAKRLKLVYNYPFDTYEFPNYSAPGKEYVDLHQLEVMEQLARGPSNFHIKQATTYFLLGSLAGLRVSDWYTFDHKKHIANDRLLLRAKKNGEWVTMPVVGRLARVLALIKNMPLVIHQQDINEQLKGIAKSLRWDKKLTTHSGRHTFAITICAEQGISAETCAELMGITVATCVDNYYKVTNRKIDKETIGAWENL